MQNWEDVFGPNGPGGSRDLREQPAFVTPVALSVHSVMATANLQLAPDTLLNLSEVATLVGGSMETGQCVIKENRNDSNVVTKISQQGGMQVWGAPSASVARDVMHKHLVLLSGKWMCGDQMVNFNTPNIMFSGQFPVAAINMQKLSSQDLRVLYNPEVHPSASIELLRPDVDRKVTVQLFVNSKFSMTCSSAGDAQWAVDYLYPRIVNAAKVG